MKDRCWVRKTISHQETEALPYYFDFTPPARLKVEGHYGSPIEQALGFPVRMAGCKSIKPLYAGPQDFGPTVKDEFGVVWSTSSVDRGVPIQPCLIEPDVSGYRFPDLASSYRFADLGDWCGQNREHYTILWVGDLWERATFMRGLNRILEDVILNPGFVDALLEAIADYVIGTMGILFERFEFDGIALSDDYGTQKSLVMSPAHWRRFVKPQLARIYGLAKKHGRSVLHHSDGDIHSIVGDLIDIGCDILHPVQPEAMDVFGLKREFGGHVTLWGGISTQGLLVKGTAEEIRNHVKVLKRELGRGGGYIVSNGITIQADVPLDNMVAMIDEGRTPG